MSETLYDFGGDGPILNFAVGNGFPPLTYRQLIAPLLSQVHVVSALPRPLWTSPPSPATSPTWETVVSDTIAIMDEHSLDRIIAAGHSGGATATIMAVARYPERFRALILLDPTIFEPALNAAVDRAREGKDDPPFFMQIADKARKRRAHFASLQEAFDFWRQRGLFAQFSDAALWLYVQGLLIPAVEGGFTLAWSPEWEAHYYETVWTKIWEDIARLPADLPILVIRGSTSDTFMEPAAALLRERLPQAEYHEITGHGHLFLCTAPEATAAIISKFLKDRGLAEVG
ncbi:MAG: alpha/beta hydrolase [Anaerolineae bacterium]|nr:alpha/beta hydrolase [Anaerolineae bacterium]